MLKKSNRFSRYFKFEKVYPICIPEICSWGNLVNSSVFSVFFNMSVLYFILINKTYDYRYFHYSSLSVLFPFYFFKWKLFCWRLNNNGRMSLIEKRGKRIYVLQLILKVLFLFLFSIHNWHFSVSPVILHPMMQDRKIFDSDS